jgi:hypothetical protein
MSNKYFIEFDVNFWDGGTYNDVRALETIGPPHEWDSTDTYFFFVVDVKKN